MPAEAVLWPRMMPRAVIFDMDGLLLDTERLYTRAIFATASALGYPMTADLHLSLIGGPWEANRTQLLYAFGEGFPAERYRRDCEARYLALCAEGIALRAGAWDPVRVLRRAIHSDGSGDFDAARYGGAPSSRNRPVREANRLGGSR